MKFKFTIKYSKNFRENGGMDFYIDEPHVGYIGWYGSVENFRMWIWGDNYKTDEVEKANKVLNKLEKDQIRLLEDLMQSCLDNNVNYTITMKSNEPKYVLKVRGCVFDNEVELEFLEFLGRR